MKITAAVVNHVNGPYELETLEMAPLRDDEVCVRLVASGICHSDEASRVGDNPYAFPFVGGHEGAGIVDAVGTAIHDISPGDAVLISYAWCGHCASCLNGHPSHCDSWYNLNARGFRDDGSAAFSKPDGTPVANFFSQSSFATYCNTTRNNLIVVDKTADLRSLAPLGCGFLTGAGTIFNGLKPRAGQSIAIFGSGAVGMAVIMAAKIAGCWPIIAVDIHDTRLALAQELGASHIINSSKEDVEQSISAICIRNGVDFSVDTSGLSDVMSSALAVLNVGGTFAPVAVTRHNLNFNPMKTLVAKNRTIKGVLMGDAIPQMDIPQLLAWHQRGLFPFEKLLTWYDFADINRAREDSASGQSIKPVLIIDKNYRPTQA